MLFGDETMPGAGALPRRPPEIHSLRPRHSRAAASAPASLPALTVPRRVRLGRAPRRARRIDPLGARPLQERISGGRGVPKCYATWRPLAAGSARRDFFLRGDTPFSFADKIRSVPAAPRKPPQRPVRGGGLG